MTFQVDFQPVGLRGPCPQGGTVLDAARALGVDLASVCGGEGTCGRCRVQITAGAVTPPSETELAELSPADLSQGYRLACLVRPLTDCRVHVPPDSLTALQRAQVEGQQAPTDVDPAVRAVMLTLPSPSLEDLRGDDLRLSEAVEAALGAPAAVSGLAMARLSGPELRCLNWQARVTVRGGEIVQVAPPDSPWLGLAADAGTTKIAVYLVDLHTGRTLAARGAMNPQIAYGEDIIARLAFADRGPAEAGRLQSLLTSGLNRLAAECCAEAGARTDDIVDAVIVGNTAIHHLLLELPVEQLATAPFVPAVCSAVNVRAREIGLELSPAAYVHLLPNIAGYVGADHVAMLLATGIADGPETALAMDIGTNTEICLAHRGSLASLSCASGPAFEGAHIKFGMRAAPGAIERVRITEGRAEYKTIGDEPLVGICGSGLLDAAAQLKLAGLLGSGGRLAGNGIREADGEREFVIAGEQSSGHGRDITVTQRDIRELQLAKGAIRTGIEVLLEDAGINAAEVDRVFIAGAFGSYIDVESARTIGMLPRFRAQAVRQVGNAAGVGARQALVSRSRREQAEQLARRVRYIELAAVPGFAWKFAEAMAF